jgi:hypothetical protein
MTVDTCTAILADVTSKVGRVGPGHNLALRTAYALTKLAWAGEIKQSDVLAWATAPRARAIVMMEAWCHKYAPAYADAQRAIEHLKTRMQNGNEVKSEDFKPYDAVLRDVRGLMRGGLLCVLAILNDPDIVDARLDEGSLRLIDKSGSTRPTNPERLLREARLLYVPKIVMHNKDRPKRAKAAVEVPEPEVTQDPPSGSLKVQAEMINRNARFVERLEPLLTELLYIFCTDDKGKLSLDSILRIWENRRE